MGEMFAYVTVFVVVVVVVVVVFVFCFVNPIIEVGIFRLRGWCMLGVFLLPAFRQTDRDRERQREEGTGMSGEAHL